MGLPQAVSALKRRWTRFFETVRRPKACRQCRPPTVWFDGSRHRSATVLVSGQIAHLNEIPCRRVKCAACKKRWTLRPPGMPAGRHFQLDVTARAVSRYLFDRNATQAAVAEESGCSRRTIRRWLDWVAGLAAPAALGRHLLAAAGAPLSGPLRTVAQLARKARTEARRRILERGAQVLVLLEALAMALGLEPPGLRSVLEAVESAGDLPSTYANPRVPALARGVLVTGRPPFTM